MAETESRVEVEFAEPRQPYQYLPLAPEEIRLVVLLPGSGLDAIQLQPQHRALAQAQGQYDALSYTWAPLEPWKEVSCGTGHLTITANLHDALVALRFPTQGRLLWIDQICINQHDLVEKNVQVRKMGQIYSHAAKVLVWLSQDVWMLNGRDQLHTFLDFCNAVTALEVNKSQPSVSPPNPSASSLLDRYAITESVWSVLFTILGSSYFRRIWMLQEIILAQECWVMLFGGYIRWEAIDDLSTTVDIHFNNSKELWEDLQRVSFPNGLRVSSRSLHNISTIRQRLKSDQINENAFKVWAAQPKWSLLDLLRKASDFQSTDPRDRIYALLGLLGFEHQCIPSQIVPDYSPSQTFDGVMRKVFIEGFADLQCLETLGYCTLLITAPTPSWMSAADLNFLALYELLQGRVWDSGGGLGLERRESVQRVPGSATCLSFRVVEVGQVTAVMYPHANTKRDEAGLAAYRRRDGFLYGTVMSIKEIRERFEACAEFARRRRTAAATEEAKHVEFCRAFVCDVKSTGERYDKTHDSGFSESKELFKTQAGPEPVSWVRNMQFGIIATSANRAEDTLAWLPLSATIGDKVYVIHGFRFPMLVRQTTQRRFAGICYVHNYMDGEALTDPGLYTEDLVFA